MDSRLSAASISLNALDAGRARKFGRQLLRLRESTGDWRSQLVSAAGGKRALGVERQLQPLEQCRHRIGDGRKLYRVAIGT